VRGGPFSLFAIFFYLWCTPALAHGPNPAGVEIVSLIDHKASLVKLTRGAAIRRVNDWQFICQAKWGGPDSPLIADDGQSQGLIISLSGPMLLDSTGQLTAFSDPALDANTVRALITLDNEIFVLTGFSKESIVWRLSETGRQAIITSTSIIDDLTIKDGQLFAATLQDGELELVVYDREGTQQATSTLLDTTLEGVISMRHTLNSSFVVNRDGDEYRLFQVEDKLVELAQSNEPIHGPVTHPMGQVLTIKRKLVRLDGQKIVPFDDETRLNCLRNDALGQSYACVEPNIVVVNADGTLGATLFALQELSEPDYSGLDDVEQADCQLNWLDLVADANLKPSDHIPEVKPAADSGCNAGPRHKSHSHFHWVLLVFLSLILVRVRLSFPDH